MMGLYLVTLDNGYHGLRQGRTLQSATNAAVKEEGTHHVRSVKKATDDDIIEVGMMGGWVPEKDIVRLKLRERRFRK